ncbi:MAG TPA: hypothetical protein VFL13_08030, partial [Candidatus Baltobacteraceae bacterium]|nr:hypothetical protein [Candidatus Baltobacteraceae bacterium]
QITGNFTSIGWGFAHGVGFTMIQAGAQSTNISSFFVNASTSTSSGSRPEVATTRNAYIRTFGDVRPSLKAALQQLF